MIAADNQTAQATAPTLDVPPLLNGTYQLSRFAYLRACDGTFVLASPLTDRRLSVPSASLLALLFQLREPAYLPTMLARHDAQTQSRLIPILEQLCTLQFLCRVDGEDDQEDEPATSNEDQGSLQTWEFHDLLFHSQTRYGRTHQPVGGTYRFGGSAPPVPPAKQYPNHSHITLPTPDLAHLGASDPSFNRVVENRKSTRSYGKTPLTVNQLGEFLFRTCRVRAVWGRGKEASTRRVYPSGGATYPLEVYAVVDTCAGIDAGLYHYDALNHALTLLDADADSLRQLQHDARQSADLDEVSPILFCISARFGRTAHKYQSIAYSLILKEVGGLFQTMWLAASAMNLAACGLGVGNADLFAAVIGSDYYAETSVGDFILGPMP